MKRSEAKEIFTIGLGVGCFFGGTVLAIYFKTWAAAIIYALLFIYNVYKAWNIYKKCEPDKEIK